MHRAYSQTTKTRVALPTFPRTAVARTAVARTAVARTAVARTAVARTAVALLALLPLASCSLLTTERVDCASNAQCIELFGSGHTCKPDGFCGPVPLDPRCDPWPEDLLSAPDKHRKAIVFGSLMDRANETKVARQQSMQLAIQQAGDELEGRHFALLRCTIEDNEALYPDVQIVAQTAEAEASKEQVVAENLALHLTRDFDVPVLLGPSSSSITSAVNSVLRDAGEQTLVISPSATSPALTYEDETEPSDEHPGLLWRTAPPDGLQGRQIAMNMAQRGVARVAIIQGDDNYGAGLTGAFLDAVNETEEAGRIRHKVRTFANQETRDAHILAAVSDGFDPDEVLFISAYLEDVQDFITLASTLDEYSGVEIFLTDSARTAPLLTTQGLESFVGRIQGTAPIQADDQASQALNYFRNAYQSRFGQTVDDLSYTANSYDAAWLAIYGSSWAVYREGRVSGPNIARGLRRVSDPEALLVDIIPTNWPTVLQRFERGQPINVEGASGKLDFDSATEELSTPIEVWSVEARGASTDTTPARLAFVMASDESP